MSSRKIAAREIIDSMAINPEQWTFDRYTARNTISGLEIWINTGPLMGGVYVYQPFKMTFWIWQRFRIWRAVKNCKALKIRQSLFGKEN